MTICPDCKQEIISSKGCSSVYLLISGNKYKRLTGGYEKGKNFEKDLTKSGEGLKCDDCGALEGNFHHFGCEREICPIHKVPMVGCDCDMVEVVS